MILAFLLVGKYWLSSDAAHKNNDEATRSFCISLQARFVSPASFYRLTYGSLNDWPRFQD